jgi:LysR family glycine cleavage system transcriptional activator
MSRDKENLSMKLSRRFPLNALRVFEVVARLENFSRAAEELGMTQTAVSYQIKTLEDYLGDAVFIRRPRALQLTETGRSLLPKVAEAFSLLSEAVQQARGATEETLDIHSPPTFASHWLARHLGEFQLEHPSVAVRLVRGGAPDVEPPPPTDVAIRIGASPWHGLICHPILRLTYTPMLNPKLADGIGGITSPADLMKLPWISNGKDLWGDWFRAAGLDPVGIKQMQLDAYGALDLEASAAVAGHGVAMLSPFLFSAELAAGRLVQPFDLALEDTKTYWLCYPPARRNAAKVKAFTAWLQAAVARERALFPGNLARPSL